MSDDKDPQGFYRKILPPDMDLLQGGVARQVNALRAHADMAVAEDAAFLQSSTPSICGNCGGTGYVTLLGEMQTSRCPVCCPAANTNAELDRSVPTDIPVRIIDKEPDSAAAISVPFTTLPIGQYIRGTSKPAEQEAAEFKLLGERLLAKTDIQRYCEHNGTWYDKSTKCSAGYTTTDILPELTGVPISDLVLAYVHGFNPTGVRVSMDGGVCTDAQTGRVTIMCTPEGIVERIYQEIQIRYGSGCDVGRILRAVKEGKPLPTTPAGGTIGHTSGLARADFS